MFAVFFFSSRRRHTRCLSDWSSDVCSSDLSAYIDRRCPVAGSTTTTWPAASARSTARLQGRVGGAARPSASSPEIGRASCRERVETQDATGTLEEEEAGGELRAESAQCDAT